MNIQNQETSISLSSNAPTGLKPIRTAYGTAAERTGMTAAVKALFTAGSMYIETDTKKVYVYDEASSDFKEW